jgi:hypothetical protein
VPPVNSPSLPDVMMLRRRARRDQVFLRCRRGWSCCGRRRGRRLRGRGGSGCCLRRWRFSTIAGDEADDSQGQTKCVYDVHGNVLFPAESFMTHVPSLGNSPDRPVRVSTDVLAEMDLSARSIFPPSAGIENKGITSELSSWNSTDSPRGSRISLARTTSVPFAGR